MVVLPIQSNEDDSVTVRFGSMEATIRGATWEEAHDAAYLLMTIFTWQQGRKGLHRIPLVGHGLDGLERVLEAGYTRIQKRIRSL